MQKRAHTRSTTAASPPLKKGVLNISRPKAAAPTKTYTKRGNKTTAEAPRKRRKLIKGKYDLDDEEDNNDQFKVVSNKSRSIDEVAEEIIENGELSDLEISQFELLSTEDQNKLEEAIIQMMI